MQKETEARMKPTYNDPDFHFKLQMKLILAN